MHPVGEGGTQLSYHERVANSCKKFYYGLKDGDASKVGGGRWSAGERLMGVIIAVPFVIFAAIAYGSAGTVDFFKHRTLVQLKEKTLPVAVHRRWGTGSTAIPVEKAARKMQKNLDKALKEHHAEFQKKFPGDESPYVDQAALTFAKPPVRPLICSEGFAENQGRRPTMEDAHFSVELPKTHGQLVGVFDGHGGDVISKFVSQQFQKVFPKYLEECDFNVHRAFEETFLEIKHMVNFLPESRKTGSTAVVSYIDKEKGLIYTATLGDSEANIYRMVEGQRKSIPLSCVRDFKSKRDENRAQAAIKGEGFNEVLFRKSDPGKKYLFNQPGDGAQNVSRAFGDTGMNTGRNIEAVIAKPKITVCAIQPGDIIVWGCDGLKDYTNESVLVKSINSKASAAKISQQLVELAGGKNCGDNVTVITLKVA